MGWIKSDSELERTDKFVDFVARLKVDPHDAFWNLHHLWFWINDKHPEGVLKGVSDTVIARQSDWTGDSKAFVDALIGSGFLDRGEGALFVHEWDQWRPDSARLKSRRVSDENQTHVGRLSEKEKKEGIPSASSLPPAPPISSSVSPNPERKETISRVKKSEVGMPFWQQMVDHLDSTWLRKKKTKFFWRGQHFKHLRSLANLYQPWGVMALWDAFMGSQDDWVRTTGYSFEAFCSHIPKLVDDSFWKIGSKRYEEQLNGPMPVLPDILKTAVS